MKLRKQFLFSLALLALLIVGIFALIPPAGSTIIANQVKFTPKHFDMQNSGNLDVTIKVRDADNVTLVLEIDNSTIRLHGIGEIAPINTWIEYNQAGRPVSFHAEFLGSAMRGLIWSIIQHLDITRPKPWVPIPLDLTITGELYDDTRWEGSETLGIYNWAGGVPPPPPP